MKYDLYVITDEGLSRGLSHAEIARQAIAGGADVIQLRDKERTGRELLPIAMKIKEITRATGALFIVNDRMDVALASGADGVHLGQDDLPLSVARKIAPSGFIIGISVGSAEEAIKAEEEGADYVAVGPVFTTISKHDAGPVCGLDTLRKLRPSVSIPIIAIGGIGKSNVRAVISAGADGVAVISAVVGQEDVTRAAKELKSLITDAKVATI